jgi:hypothetical protein
MKISLYLFFILILYVFPILPVWNIKNTSIDLLPGKTTADNHEYTIQSGKMYDLPAELKKKITRKSDLSVEHNNYLTLDSVEKGTVNFEYFESYYKWKGNQILCPKGNYNPYKVSESNYDEIKYSDDWIQNEKTDLKCYWHRSGVHLLVYYLRNGENHFLELSGSGTSLVENSKLRFDVEEIYDFRLVNGDTDMTSDTNSYAFMAIIKSEGLIKLMGTTMYLFGNSQSLGPTLDLFEPKKYSQGYFDSNNYFYYFTYNDISDFTSGYSLTTVSNSNFNIISGVTIKNNDKSPFLFLEEVEIKQMDIMHYNQFVYYTIVGKETNKTYHGIFDIKANKIIFNTDEELYLFIPYIKDKNSDSMLAINKDSAYRVCYIKKEDTGDCLGSCSDKILYDIDGTKCVPTTYSCATYNKLIL